MTSSERGSVHSTSLPAGEDFLDRLALTILAQHADAVRAGDLSAVLILVPALPIAAELRAALLRVAPTPMLLPRFDTLPHWVESMPLTGIAERTPDAERLVLLYEALRERRWFDEAALWGVAAEMGVLFDELTTASVTMPIDESALLAQLQAAYALRDSEPLAFEARVVHALWGALVAAGHVDRAADYARRMAALTALTTISGPADAAPLIGPLIVLLDAPPAESLDPAEQAFLVRYGQDHALAVFHPEPRGIASSSLLETLAAAWPERSNDEMLVPLVERAAALVLTCPESPLIARLHLVATAGREQEAQAVVAQVADWLNAGLRRIVLIAQDRLTARRVRALLEREAVLVSDETGWKLSTSRAAAAVDALLETVAAGAYHRDVVDLCKSPYVFSDVGEAARMAAVFALDAAIRRASVRAGFSRMRRCLLQSDADVSETLAIAMLERIEAACALLGARPAPLAQWLARLYRALEQLGALEPLLADAAGKVMLDLFDDRRRELAASTALFSFSAWRDWLNRELEAATFRDAGISSPIVVTPLNAVCMRRFEAAVLIGGDAQQLAPATNGQFFNQSVRRELGLRTQADGERELRRDLELLLATVPRVMLTWQAERDGEANLLAPEFALLSSLHQVAWGDDLQRPPLPARGEPAPDAVTAPDTTSMALPAAPLALIPARISVSGYASVVACPYRFFARHVLGLGEMDEVTEEMDKSDFGSLVHRVLERFHTRHPVITALDETFALSELLACVAEVFAPAVEENFLAHGWRLRWEKRLPAYLAWQREHEAQGWRWTAAETRVAHKLSLRDGAMLEFYGRIDRVDLNESGEAALLDYKTQTVKAIRDRLPEDVQLPAYALLHGNAVQAAYVALDDEKLQAVSAVDANQVGALTRLAQAHGERLQNAFDALRAGAQMPAHGVDGVCRYCEMRGLCRRDHVPVEPVQHVG